MTIFGKLLRDFRKRAALSQRGLAQEANITTSYISRLESGEREFASRDLILRLSEILKLSEKELEYWLNSAGYISPRKQALASSGISRLMESLNNTVNEVINEYENQPKLEERK